MTSSLPRLDILFPIAPLMRERSFLYDFLKYADILWYFFRKTTSSQRKFFFKMPTKLHYDFIKLHQSANFFRNGVSVALDIFLIICPKTVSTCFIRAILWIRSSLVHSILAYHIFPVIAWTILLIVSESTSFFNSHSQTTIMFHPICCNLS